MCLNCYREKGSPPFVFNEKVSKAVELIKAVYRVSSVGGVLHIVLDDWNTEPQHVEFCANQAARDGCSKEELACLNHIKTMTEPELLTALAINDGYITPEGQ